MARSYKKINHNICVGSEVISYKGHTAKITNKLRVGRTTKWELTFPDGTARLCGDSQVVRGNFKDRTIPSYYGVGFLGNGSYKIEGTIEGKHWVNMLSRCYSQKVKPSYKDCRVSEEFLNFQIFAEWCSTQEGYNLEGWQLDKDLLYSGNKIYSADACTFLPREINNMINFRRPRTVNKKLPLGVVAEGKKYKAKLCIEGKQTVLGVFESPEEAGKLYLESKTQHIRNTSDKYRGSLGDRAYQALQNYKVGEHV